MATMAEPVKYSHMTAFPAEGARVGIVSCLRCGVAVFFDPRDEFDALQRHKVWHEATDSATPTQHEETP
jgi:hypothetical protein